MTSGVRVLLHLTLSADLQHQCGLFLMTRRDADGAVMYRKGAFGSVYKELLDGTEEVAVKHAAFMGDAASMRSFAKKKGIIYICRCGIQEQIPLQHQDMAQFSEHEAVVLGQCCSRASICKVLLSAGWGSKVNAEACMLNCMLLCCTDAWPMLTMLVGFSGPLQLPTSCLRHVAEGLLWWVMLLTGIPI